MCYAGKMKIGLDLCWLIKIISNQVLEIRAGPSPCWHNTIWGAFFNAYSCRCMIKMKFRGLMRLVMSLYCHHSLIEHQENLKSNESSNSLLAPALCRFNGNRKEERFYCQFLSAKVNSIIVALPRFSVVIKYFMKFRCFMPLQFCVKIWKRIKVWNWGGELF